MSSRKEKVQADSLAALDSLGGFDDLTGGGFDSLETLEQDAGEPTDPIGDLDYDGMSNEEVSTKETSAVLAAFKARAQREQERFALATDSEYWFAVCFQSREQKEHFLRELKLLQQGDKYLDGQLLAKRMGIALPPAEVPYNTSTKIDAKLANLVKDV